MYAQLVNFKLDGMTKEEWHQQGLRKAERYLSVDGLRSKIWLMGEDEPYVGAMYLFDSREDMGAFQGGELMEGIRAHTNYFDLLVRSYKVLPDLTRITDRLAILEEGS